MTTQIFSAAALKHYATMVVTGLVFLISAIVFMVQGTWALAGICLVVLPTVLLPQLIEYWTNVRMAVNLQIQYALLLLLGPYVGGTLGLYRIWDPWDSIVYFYSGIPVSFAIIAALGTIQHQFRLALPVCGSKSLCCLL